MPICSKIVSNRICTSLQNTNAGRWKLTIGSPKSGITNKTHLTRFMWMQQLQTLYEIEIQWPKDELWVIQSLGSTRAVAFCPKSFTFHDIPFFWTLLMRKRLTWSIAEMDSSLNIIQKNSPIFRCRHTQKQTHSEKSLLIVRFFWNFPSKKF